MLKLALILLTLKTPTPEELKVDPFAMRREWAAVSTDAQKLVSTALAQRGVPYRYATSDPERGFDCSGLVKYAAASVGVDLPSNSGQQNRALETVPEPRVGDLVHYPGHVSIYIGQGLVVHAPQPGGSVEITNLPGRGDLTFSQIVP